ncbi:mitochondrial import inner membrane translocase subunit TIM16 [Paramecium bursaria]
MVKQFLVKIIIEVGAMVGKSVIKAYKNVAQNQKQGQPSPFTNFINQSMQAANLTHKPMTKPEAIKILNIDPEKQFDAETVLKVYWRQFHKNDPLKGGSFYVQSVIYNAKIELMKDFPDVNESELLAKFQAEKVQQDADDKAEKDGEGKPEKSEKTETPNDTKTN